MKKKCFTIAEDNEIRGFRIRLYPTAEQRERLNSIRETSRLVWNDLVRQQEDAFRARQAYAVRYNLVGPRPSRPNYDGMSPADAKAAKTSYLKACGEWNRTVSTAVAKDPACAYRTWKDVIEHHGKEYDYQYLNLIVLEKGRERLHSSILQALMKNWYSKGAKRRKRSDRHVPLGIKTGKAFELGEFGERKHRSQEGPGENFYNCRVKIAGMQILGRLPGKVPGGRVLEGVSLREEADGWWASIKVEVTKRQLEPVATGSAIGIDVGLDNIAAFSNGRRITNKRASEYAQLVAARQKEATQIADLQTRKCYMNTTSRMELRAQRCQLHDLHNKIVKPLRTMELIFIEKLPEHIGQLGGSSKMSVMRKIAELLKQRFGDRVREVDPSYTSQICSQCGHKDKESWSYDHGRFGECTQCGYKSDRDVNAARNILHKGLNLHSNWYT